MPTKKEIATHISRVASEITNDYRGKNVVFIGVLKGAFLFLADLVREIDLDNVEVDFLQASSYGSKVISSEKVILKKDIDLNIKGKDMTPYLLSKIAHLTDKKSLESNIKLIFNNAIIGAKIAVSYYNL